MQLSSTTSVAPSPLPAGAPARDRLRPLLPDYARNTLPDELLNVRVASGTLASEFDRAISVRFEGPGVPSQRAIVPETSTTVKLLASPAGPAFERLARATVGAADAAQGHEDIRSLTLLPDEHAGKAQALLNYFLKTIRTAPAGAFGQGPDAIAAPMSKAHRATIQKITEQVAQEIPGELGKAAAWNDSGTMVVAPDVARRLLSTIGAYQPKRGDDLLLRPPALRERILRDDWDTLVHESHHSVTPTTRYTGQTARFEEAISTIFGRRDRYQAARSAGAADAFERVAERPKQTPDTANLGWAAWNRSHLPKPDQATRTESTARYNTAPRVLRELLGVAGVDFRTKEGHATAFDVLQGAAAEFVPRRLAVAISEHLGVKDEHLERLVERVRRSVGHADGAGHVTEMLQEIGALPAAR